MVAVLSVFLKRDKPFWMCQPPLVIFGCRQENINFWENLRRKERPYECLHFKEQQLLHFLEAASWWVRTCSFELATVCCVLLAWRSPGVIIYPHWCEMKKAPDSHNLSLQRKVKNWPTVLYCWFFGTAVRLLTGKVNTNIAPAHVTLVFIPEKPTREIILHFYFYKPICWRTVITLSAYQKVTTNKWAGQCFRPDLQSLDLADLWEALFPGEGTVLLAEVANITHPAQLCSASSCLWLSSADKRPAS